MLKISFDQGALEARLEAVPPAVEAAVGAFAFTARARARLTGHAKAEAIGAALARAKSVRLKADRAKALETLSPPGRGRGERPRRPALPSPSQPAAGSLPLPGRERAIEAAAVAAALQALGRAP